MSINNLRESPIPPQPKGWGLLGQQVEEAEAYEREMEAAVLEEYQAEMEANARASEGLRYTDEVIEERRWREQ